MAIFEQDPAARYHIITLDLDDRPALARATDDFNQACEMYSQAYRWSVSNIKLYDAADGRVIMESTSGAWGRLTLSRYASNMCEKYRRLHG